MATEKNGAKRLTPDEIDRIVELHLDGWGFRKIAAEVGCTFNTARKHWHNWLDGFSQERREERERQQSQVVAHLQSVAVTARRGAVRARHEQDLVAERGFLSEERQAWRALSAIAGYDAPKQVQVSASHTMTDDEAARIIAEFEDG